MREAKDDSMLAELAAVNTRLKTVMAFLKTRHTSDSLDSEIQNVQSRLGDYTPAFVPVDSAMVRGTRHMGSLLQLIELMEIKAGVSHADHALEECTALLERKVALLKALYRI